MSASAAAASVSSPITFTLFEDVYAKEKQEFADHEWQALVALIREPRRSYESKSACPLISLAEYGEQRTDHQSLRHAANVLRVWGVEGDYDGETTPLEFAAEKLQKANIKAVLYSSPSNSKEKPRWRVIAPLSESHLPEKRAEYLGRINRVLGGILASESFALSQAYFVGRVRGRDYESVETTGRCIDLAIDVEPLYPNARPTGSASEPDPRTDQELRDAISRGEDRQHTMLSLSGRLAARGMNADDIAAELYRLLDGNPDAKSEHWSDLRERVPRLATTAVSKFSDPRERSSERHWLPPEHLPDTLPAVRPFDFDLLPESARPYVADIAERMQCPPDFVAVSLVSVLSAALGRGLRVLPKEHDDWSEFPNLWGLIVGKPGVMKTPAFNEVLWFLRTIEDKAAEDYEHDMREYEAASLVNEAQKSLAKDRVRKAVENRKDAQAIAMDALGKEPGKPPRKRYIVNDATVEKLGEVLQDNAHGVLLFRDEILGFLRTLEAEGREGSRSFFLEAWNAKGSFTVDRISRGSVRIPVLCVGILGSSQPGPLHDYVRQNLRADAGNDGLLQRFQLAVWPDLQPKFRNVDRAPNLQARTKVQDLIRTFLSYRGEEPRDVHFDSQAQALFNVWRIELEERLRADALPDILAQHLCKYRKLIPVLAMVFHITDKGVSAIGEEALGRAIAWGEYLESHARRIYAPAVSRDVMAAHALGRKIKAGEVKNGFFLRDIYRKGWAGLTERDDVQRATDVLTDFNWLRRIEEPTEGRDRITYQINPALLGEPSR